MEKEKEDRGRIVKDREKRKRLEKEREDREMVDKEREEREVDARRRIFESREASFAGVFSSRKVRRLLGGAVAVGESAGNFPSSILLINYNGVMQQDVMPQISSLVPTPPVEPATIMDPFLPPIPESSGVVANMASNDAATSQLNQGGQIEWRGALLSSSTSLTLQRVLARHRDIFESMLPMLPCFLSATVDSLAKVLQLLDSRTPTSFTVAHLRFIETALMGIRCINVRLDWLDSRLSALGLLRGLAVEKLEVECLEKVVAEATLSLEEAKSRVAALEAKIDTDSNNLFDMPFSLGLL